MTTRRGAPEEVGTFDVTSGKLVVSDPCYTAPDVLPFVRNGKWTASVVKSDEGGWGIRIAELIACVRDEKLFTPCGSWEKAPFEVGVDSGQAGIFDNDHFRKDEDERGYKYEYRPTLVTLQKAQLEARLQCRAEEGGSLDDQVDAARFRQIAMEKAEPLCPDDLWYSMCCDKTLTRSAGIVPGGVVSNSGFGDGGYDAYVLKDKDGTVVAVRIIFIEEGTDDRDDDDDDYDPNENR